MVQEVERLGLESARHIRAGLKGPAASPPGMQVNGRYVSGYDLDAAIAAVDGKAKRRERALKFTAWAITTLIALIALAGQFWL